MKNFAQDGRRLPLNPAVWYRGWTAGVLMGVPMTFVQFGTARRLERLFEKRERGPEGSAADADADFRKTISVKHSTLSPPAARFAAAWLAGAASGACIQPLDVVMTQQQKFGGSLNETVRRIANTETRTPIGARTRGGFALFARGARLTVTREAFYSCGYLASVPTLREARPDLPLAACAVASGLGAAVLTQPLDTVKTVMQSNLVQPRDDAAVSDVRRAAPAGGRGAARLGGLGYGATAAALVNEGGVLSLWRGLVPRGASSACVSGLTRRGSAAARLPSSTAGASPARGTRHEASGSSFPARAAFSETLRPRPPLPATARPPSAPQTAGSRRRARRRPTGTTAFTWTSLCRPPGASSSSAATSRNTP